MADELVQVNAMARTPVRAHQFLHGYDDGHRLLRSSIALSGVQQKLMLVLSDLSGPSLVQGFESYLTAYPLIDVNAYAVARTWYAHEMKRPGCVWTHTLVLTFEDLARLQEPNVILRAFRRPSLGSTMDEYEREVELGYLDQQWGEWNQEALDARVSRVVLSALYTNAERAVLIGSSNSSQYERMVLEVWAQQPPVLRARSAFCTGALSPRTINSRLLDLQVVPRTFHNVPRPIANAVVISDVATDDASPTEGWLDLLTDDLVLQERFSSGTFRRFLNEFAWEMNPPRAIVRPLTQLYYVLTGKTETLIPSGIADTLGEHLPSAEAGRALKAAVLGPLTTSLSAAMSLPKLSEPMRLEALALSRWHDAFDANNLNVTERATAFWHDQRESAVQLLKKLSESDPGPFAQRLLEGFASAVTDPELVDLCRSQPGIVSLLVRSNPSLALRKTVWQQSIELQETIITALPSQDDLHGLGFPLEDLVAEMVEGGALTADRASRHFGPAFATAIIEHAARNADWAVHGAWARALEIHRDAIARWVSNRLSPTVSALLAAASVLELADVQHLVKAESWLPLGEELHRRGARSDSRASAFLLAVGFTERSAAAARLVALLFQSVHQEASEDRLPHLAWTLLEPLVPSLSWWRDWDRCERLRRGLVERFIQQEWDLRYFLEALKDTETLELTLEGASSISGGKAFVRKLRKGIDEGILPATRSQRAVVSTSA